MQLKSIKIVGLHGSLDLAVDFKPNISLLVGINGSGKTSILNVIDWLLKPNIKKLASVEYKELSLKFVSFDRPYVLKAKKDKKQVVFSIESSSTPLPPITIKLINPHPYIGDEYTYEEAYAGLGPEEHEMPMWELMKSFPSPTIITLDRTIAADADDIHYAERSPRSDSSARFLRSPLRHVQEVMYTKFSEYRAKATQNDSELKTRIVMSALQDPMTPTNRAVKQPMTETEITHLEEKVIKYLSGSAKTDEVSQQIHQFFKASRLLAKARNNISSEHELILHFIRVQYRQIENLAKAFNDFDVKNASAFKKLGEFLSAINAFFKDSGKELYFDDSTGQLVFKFLKDGDGRKETKGRDINHLSSGEQQILILFTFLAFVAKSGSVFIVDEPELSLHPKWQHEFMQGILQLQPENTQLLLATHSPDIVGRYKSSCVVLQGSKSNG